MSNLEAPQPHVVLDAGEIDRALTRIALQIIEINKGTDKLLLLGIPTRGVPLARRLAAKIADLAGVEPACGELDITMYRDDLRSKPTLAVGRTRIPGSTVDGLHVVLVDDVLFSGRTIAAALDALKDLGRPAVIKLATLVDRGRRELPIQADMVGKAFATSADEHVAVHLVENDGIDEVTVARKDAR